MPHDLLFEMQQKQSQNIKQLQRLIMSRQMQQAIHILEKPILELGSLVDNELETNPLLEYSQDEEEEREDEEVSDLKVLEDENKEESFNEDNVPEEELAFKEDDFEIMRRLDEEFRDHFSESGQVNSRCGSDQDKLQTFLESTILSQETFFEHLMKQAHEVFDDAQHLLIAEAIIGSLNEGGVLTVPVEEISLLENCSVDLIEYVLSIIQGFDPIGVGARNLRESLLIQLKNQKKEISLAFAIVDKHFDDLLHNRILVIKKSLHCTSEEIGDAIERDIAKLDLHPGTQWGNPPISVIVPDVVLRQEEDQLIVAVNDDAMPRLRLNKRYMAMLEDPTLPLETKDFIKQKIVSAKWLLQNMMHRNDTLEKISQSLVKWQGDFFLNPNGQLVPLTMKVIAEELGVHESTIARGVSGKYIDTPRGILPLRAFFTSSLSSAEGDISSKTAKDLLMDLIAQEDKKHPLSDEVLSSMIKEKGIECARRTVAKYRLMLKIGNAQQRRKF